MFLPAKHRILFLFSNRYVIHIAIVIIAGLTIGTNLTTSTVRAETFGVNSILYGLVVADDSSVVEIVSASQVHEPVISSYLGETTIGSDQHIDFNFYNDSYATTDVGVSSMSQAVKDGQQKEEKKVTQARKDVETYTVVEGDSLGKIADKYDLSLSTLLWANNLTVRSVIKLDQTLSIPPVDGVVYTVKKGDTLGSIAKTYSTEQEKIITFNDLENSNSLSIGQKLILPDAEVPVPVVRRAAPVSTIFRAPSSTSVVGSESSSTVSWVWPTDWRAITQYYGWRHTGIDIDGDFTTKSYAAADGIVIYSGWRNGYGITVEVDHGNGLVTRYAHHSKYYVSIGDVVSAGQSLAQTGTTGRSTGTHLHFEVIKNGKFQNPFDYVR